MELEHPLRKKNDENVLRCSNLVCICRSATYLRQLAQKQQKSRGEDTKEEDEMQPSREEQLLSDDRSSKKQKRSQTDDKSSDKDKHELSSLVRSVKRKVGTLQS